MVAERTINQYTISNRKLNEAGINVTKPEQVLEYFEMTGLSVSSQKVYLSAIKYSNPESFHKTLQDKLNELYKNQNERDMKQQLTKKQELNFVAWKDILAVQKKLATIQSKTDTDYKQYLVASLYTLNAPVRADYGEMEVFAKYNKTRTGNELIWNKSPRFIFRVYKTAKTYGEVKIPVSKALQRVITAWFTHLGATPKYLLGETPSNSNTFAVYIQETFKKHTGKVVGVSLLRHSYITYIFPKLKTLTQKQAVAKRMLHSRDLQEKYVSLKDME
jgi:hypothetical protein